MTGVGGTGRDNLQWASRVVSNHAIVRDRSKSSTILRNGKSCQRGVGGGGSKNDVILVQNMAGDIFVHACHILKRAETCLVASQNIYH